MLRNVILLVENCYGSQSNNSHVLKKFLKDNFIDGATIVAILWMMVCKVP